MRTGGYTVLCPETTTPHVVCVVKGFFTGCCNMSGRQCWSATDSETMSTTVSRRVMHQLDINCGGLRLLLPVIAKNKFSNNTKT